MLDIRKVLEAKPKPHEAVELKRLTTVWGEGLNPSAVLPEHPRPQFARADIQMLNGVWTCGFEKIDARCETESEPRTGVVDAGAPDADTPGAGAGEVRASIPESWNSEGFGPCPTADECPMPIVVPFSPEAPLSGVNRQLQPDEVLLYHRVFQLESPLKSEDAHVVLHFDAVDYRCKVWVNDVAVGAHVGGYLPFAFDVTEVVREGENTIAVAVLDPSETGTQLLGKQRLSRGDIWYTAQSGIWQPVWLEFVPKRHIARAHVHADASRGCVVVEAEVVGRGELVVHVVDRVGAVVGKARSTVDATATVRVEVPVSDFCWWSPDDPYLYDVELSFGDDVVLSYAAFRTVSVRADGRGVKRFFLNGKPLFVKGVLDQGYWPDGLMTAPSDEALVFDIEAARQAGFNMMRKHLKVENARWYYHCDRMGMLVWQDMLCAGGGDVSPMFASYVPTLLKASWTHMRDDTPKAWERVHADNEAYRAEWESEMRLVIDYLRDHPSIVTWTLFNEGWGQFCACDMLQKALAIDSTRPIDATSGWYDQRCGDYFSVHNYFRPLEVWRDRAGRAFVVSEFGGLSLGVEGHAALESDYGYGATDSPEQWREQLRDLLRHMDSLEAKGLAGYVYTQLTDVEEETNGIVTYDRRVNKLAE